MVKKKLMKPINNNELIAKLGHIVVLKGGISSEREISLSSGSAVYAGLQRLGFHVSDGDKLLLDTLDNDETITLSDIGSLTFEDIRTPDKIEIQGLNANEQNWGGGADDDNIILEGFGQILLDGSDSDSTDAGHHLLQETSKRKSICK